MIFFCAVCLIGFMVSVVSGGKATPRNLEQIIVGRCEEYQHVVRPDLFNSTTVKNCTDLWRKFHKAFANKDPCNVTVESYNDFVETAFHDIDTVNKVMYWSGLKNMLAVDYARTDNVKYTSIQEILAAYVIRNVDNWCGQVGAPGVNYTSCPPWGHCPLLASTSFWTALSKSFAKQVKGTVHLMLNGSSGQAYRNTSIFASSELKNLDKSRTPGVHVHLVYAISGLISEKCGQGSLVTLEQDVKKKGMTYKCSDDDQAILYFQCVTEMGADRCQKACPARSKSALQKSSLALPLALLMLTIITTTLRPA